MTGLQRWGWQCALWLLLIVGSAPAYSVQMSCETAKIELFPYLQVFQDPTGQMGIEEVVEVVNADFVPLEGNNVLPHTTKAAIWLRFELANASDIGCSRWLTIGSPRLDDIQLYTPQPQGWLKKVTGLAYPPDQWAVKAPQPRFLLQIDPGVTQEIFVRIESGSPIQLRPVLWDNIAIIKHATTVRLFDGLALGVALMTFFVGIIIGLVMGLRALLLNTWTLLFFTGALVVSNGYLFFLPSLLPYSHLIIAVLAATAYAFFYTYLFHLLRLPLLAPGLRLAAVLYVAGGVLLYLGTATSEFVWAREATVIYRYGVFALAGWLCLSAWQRRVKWTWLAWVMLAQVVLHVAVSALGLFKESPWFYGSTMVGFSSTFLLVLLVILTLVSSVAQSRRNEKDGLNEIAYLKQAEHERLEAKVEQRTEQLRETLKARSLLLARISHDLRSPLGSIISYAREARNRVGPDYLQRIERHARQQLEVLDDVLTLAQTELQHIELSLAPGYLFGFLHEIEEEGRYLAERQNNQLQVHFADDLPSLVHADFPQLRRILINLLHNSAKFTKNGSITFKVVGKADDSSKHKLTFSVEDTGIGMPNSAVDDLLVSFKRGNNAAGVEGFGLGLSIVTELLTQMGSQLNILRHTTVGTTFNFDLELEAATEEELDNVFLESHISDMDGDSRRIVLVDDVELTRLYLSELLNGYGFDVRVARDGQTALALLDQEPADLLIVDQVMPGMDGWELLRLVREAHPGLPTLLYSASPPKTKRRIPGLAFDASLLKPATTEQLLERIAELCGLPETAHHAVLSES